MYSSNNTLYLEQTTTRCTPSNAANLRIPTDWSVPYPRQHICIFPRGYLEGHNCGVNYAMFHPTLPLISAAADRTIKIWRMSETKAWEVDSCRGHFNNVSTALLHPKHKLIVSCGLIVFKLERERPVFAVHQDSLYYIRDKYVRSYDLNTGVDLGLLSVHTSCPGR
ncbi:hypothetical protein B0H14DRAFT_1594171 [Mycena olivaceomarginata]|nr:hypothetical protein B0H14DRAFT_1594171 [Mycena olivaceomarginata]